MPSHRVQESAHPARPCEVLGPHPDLAVRLPDAGELDGDVVRAPVLDQPDLLGARLGQLPQRAALHDLEERLQLVVVDRRLVLHRVSVVTSQGPPRNKLSARVQPCG